MKKFNVWTLDDMTRVYTSDAPIKSEPVTLNLARNDRSAFQIAFRAQGFYTKFNVKTIVPEGLKVTVRKQGTVYLKELNTDTPETELDGKDKVPGPVPDPLLDLTDDGVQAFPGVTGSLWVSVISKSDTKPGEMLLHIDLEVSDGSLQRITCIVTVYPLVVERDDAPWCAHWFYPNCIYTWYNLPPFSEEAWLMVERYMQNLYDHYTNVLNTFLYTMPVNGDMDYYQLLKVSRTGKNMYTFDWSNVIRWIRIAKNIGFTRFLWPHFFTQWGAKHPPVIYENAKDPNEYEGKELWPKDTAGTAPEYRAFLEQMLPELKIILDQEGVLEGSLFHLSDEPLQDEEHLDNYRKGRKMILEIAPWIRCSDAINHVEYAQQGMTDLPIAGLTVSHEFRKNKIDHFAYFCCGPRGTWLNRLMDTPLAKIRGSGWLAYTLEAKGIMHWGYNYWYKICTSILIDPYSVTNGEDYPMIPHGDCFVVYPGKSGPVDSIRWEVFAQSLADAALVRSAGIEKDHPLLQHSFQEYNVFPKHASWYSGVRRDILSGRIQPEQGKEINAVRQLQ